MDDKNNENINTNINDINTSATENTEIDKSITPFNDLKSIRTLETDLADVVNDKNYGKNIIKIITNPFKTKEVVSSEEGGSDYIINKRRFLMIISFVTLFIIIFIIVFNLYTPKFIENKTNLIDNNQNTATTTPVIKNTKDIINPEIIHTADFSKYNRSEIIDEIKKITTLYINSRLKENTNIQIKTNISLIDLFEKIRYSGTQNLLRSIDGDYNFGYVVNNNNQIEGYILIKLNNFDLAFKSMLDWENYIYTDLENIILINETQSTTTSNLTQNSSTSIKTNNKTENIFIDKILKNSDTREYTDSVTKSKIIYGFINNKYLLITSGYNSYINIKERLINQNTLR